MPVAQGTGRPEAPCLSCGGKPIKTRQDSGLSNSMRQSNVISFIPNPDDDIHAGQLGLTSPHSGTYLCWVSGPSCEGGCLYGLSKP